VYDEPKKPNWVMWEEITGESELQCIRVREQTEGDADSGVGARCKYSVSHPDALPPGVRGRR
jgi:hypothetical protein